MGRCWENWDFIWDDNWDFIGDDNLDFIWDELEEMLVSQTSLTWVVVCLGLAVLSFDFADSRIHMAQIPPIHQPSNLGDMSSFFPFRSYSLA
jgi:hypothetical protein